jgi:predicted flavoprotein YhiN
MQSKIVPNLFFAGEILDVDGITGGFNFQHAWTSGWIAAKEISRKSVAAITNHE